MLAGKKFNLLQDVAPAKLHTLNQKNRINKHSEKGVRWQKSSTSSMEVSFGGVRAKNKHGVFNNEIRLNFKGMTQPSNHKRTHAQLDGCQFDEQ